MDFPINPPIGERVRRKETQRFVTGTGRFVDDLLPPGTLHASFARSPCAHARIKSVDVSAARAMPGVRAVFTGADIAGRVKPMRIGGSPLLRPLKLYPLAVDKIRYFGEPIAVVVAAPFPRRWKLYPPAVDKTRFFGEPIAVVVADNRYLAEDAVEAITVDYEPLAAVIDPEAALEANATTVDDELGGHTVYKFRFTTDGLDDIFAKADVVVKERIRSHRITACPIEPRAYLEIGR